MSEHSETSECDYPVAEACDPFCGPPLTLRMEFDGSAAMYDWNVASQAYERRPDSLPGKISADGHPIATSGPVLQNDGGR